jgi:hypothetical protein
VFSQEGGSAKAGAPSSQKFNFPRNLARDFSQYTGERPEITYETLYISSSTARRQSLLPIGFEIPPGK